MSTETRPDAHVPGPEREEREAAAHGRPSPRARTRSMVLIGIGTLALFLVLLALGVVPRMRNQRELAADAQRAQSTVPEVSVVRPEPASAADLSLAATTQAIQDAIIYARTSGYLSKRHVDIGDRVTTGKLLAEIASPEIDQQLRQAQADLQQSERNLDLQKASLDLARATMARYQAADAEGAVAKLVLDQSVSAYRTGQAAVAAAEAYVESNKANVQRLRELVSFQRVLAPFNGTVIQRNVDVGALITAGSPVNNIAVAPSSVTGAANGLFEVAQFDTLRVFVNVPQAYAPNVTVGLPVRVTVRGQLMQPVTGTVTRTASALDPGTRTLLTQVDIPNPSHRMLPGAFVYVDFKIGPSGTRWRVPATAMIFNAQGTRVVIVGTGNKLRFQDVVLGRDLGTSIDIQAGLHGNELVVSQPTVSLQEGQVVKPVESHRPSGG
jgi:multidrug efflux pump subunit AcrA (membrane-fusion protein)